MPGGILYYAFSSARAPKRRTIERLRGGDTHTRRGVGRLGD